MRGVTAHTEDRDYLQATNVVSHIIYPLVLYIDHYYRNILIGRPPLPREGQNPLVPCYTTKSRSKDKTQENDEHSLES